MDEETNQETEQPEEELTPPEGWEEYNYEDAPEEEQPQEEEEQPQPEETAPAAAPSIAPYVPTEGATPDEAYIREQLGDEGFAAIDRLVSARLAAAQQSMVVASAYAAEAATRAPDLFRVHGAEIQRNMASLPASIRGTQQGLATAVMGVALRQASETGDWLGAIQSLAALTGNKPAQAQQPRVKPVVPPSQRPPSPGGARPSAPAATSGRERLIQSLIKDTGVSRAEAEAMALDPKISGRR